MFAFIISSFMVWLLMWGFFKFMYPKPPAAFMPKQGDIISARDCDFCGHPLAEYRGVLEPKPVAALTAEDAEQIQAYQEKLAALPEVVPATSDLSRKQKKAHNMNNEALAKQRYDYNQAIKARSTWFFCNYDHQADFHQQQDKSLES